MGFLDTHEAMFGYVCPRHLHVCPPFCHHGKMFPFAHKVSSPIRVALTVCAAA